MASSSVRIPQTTPACHRYPATVAIDAIRDDVLALSAEDRAELAAALLDSLGPEPESDQDEVDRAWTVELERRAAALDSGEDTGVSWEDALAKARQSLAE